MRVALVHDDLVQWGGAERALLAISEIFPDAPIYTAIFDKDNKLLLDNFQNKKIVTSFLQNIPGTKSIYKSLLPFYPIAFEQFDFSSFDLVISSTTRFAKSIITKPNTKHICFCHTPPRFLWNYSQDKNKGLMLSPFLSYQRLLDQISARRVDHFIAGSKNAAARIKKIYKVASDVCYPFVDEKFFSADKKFNGDYYLIISRLNKYKKVDLAVNVFNESRKHLKIVGSGPELASLKKIAGDNIEFLANVDDELLINLLAGAKALIVIAEEDFGLTSLEAQAMGIPVIALNKGGARETIINNKTGVFFQKQDSESLKEAIDNLQRAKFQISDCIENAQKFTKVKFKSNFATVIDNLVNQAEVRSSS